MTATPLLAAESIVFRAGGRDILLEAYVDALPGTITALVGRSGAGKTTLFEIIVGRRVPNHGQVRWDGERIAASHPGLARRGFCYLPDRSWLPSGFCVADILDLAAARAAVDWKPIADRTGAAGWVERRVGTLSGGELRLTEVAFALTLHPRMLLLDEPFRGLEPRHREKVADLLRGLAREGAAVLYADHDARLVGETADRLFSIEQGRTRLVPEFRSRPLKEWYHEWPK